MKKYDALIIGAGHNGLVCAFYLAKAGLKVRILEARDVVGGAAVTEEFAPGFRNSVASYTVSLLQPKVIRDMKLVDQGYKVIERHIKPEELANYDECFLTGTAAEVTPVSLVGEYSFKPGRACETLINAYTEAVTPKKVAAE